MMLGLAANVSKTEARRTIIAGGAVRIAEDPIAWAEMMVAAGAPKEVLTRAQLEEIHQARIAPPAR